MVGFLLSFLSYGFPQPHPGVSEYRQSGGLASREAEIPYAYYTRFLGHVLLLVGFNADDFPPGFEGPA